MVKDFFDKMIALNEMDGVSRRHHESLESFQDGEPGDSVDELEALLKKLV